MTNPNPSVIVTDIDDTLISYRTGQLHPILIPMLRAIQDELLIAVVTSRPESRRQETADWLELVGIHPHYIYMKEDGDRRPPYVYKRSIIRNMIGSDRVLLLMDDDPNVRVMAEIDGIATLCP